MLVWQAFQLCRHSKIEVPVEWRGEATSLIKSSQVESSGRFAEGAFAEPLVTAVQAEAARGEAEASHGAAVADVHVLCAETSQLALQVHAMYMPCTCHVHAMYMPCICHVHAMYSIAHAHGACHGG